MPHEHHHHSHQVDYGRAFALGIVLNTAFVVVEAGYGFAVDSLALLADAGHNLSDVLGLLVAWAGEVLTRRAATPRRTYGLRRSSILAALLNAVLLLAAVGGIIWEAVLRLQSPEGAPHAAVIWVAAAGIVINLTTALLFAGGRHHDLNVRGAYLHMAADAAVSLGVVVAGVVMLQTGWTWVDPLVGIAIAVVILLGTWGLLCESLDLALDAVPRGIDPQAVRDFLAADAEVSDVHDLHIWGLSTRETALTAHLVAREAVDTDALLRRVLGRLREQFRIAHATLQIERDAVPDCPGGLPCETLDEHGPHDECRDRHGTPS